jgi:hypothetical protein
VQHGSRVSVQQIRSTDTCGTKMHGYLIEMHRFSVNGFVALTKKKHTHTHNTDRRSILSAANTSQGCQSTEQINIALSENVQYCGN